MLVWAWASAAGSMALMSVWAPEASCPSPQAGRASAAATPNRAMVRAPIRIPWDIGIRGREGEAGRWRSLGRSGSALGRLLHAVLAGEVVPDGLADPRRVLR